jgi:hypothetical protein
MPDICVIGNGWYGCHAACYLLKKGANVTIIDKNDFFSGASSKNQNRLHLGYHYPRSKKTIDECVSGYSKFMDVYSEYTHSIDSNMYFIHHKSLVTHDLYCKEFEALNDSILDIPFRTNDVNKKCFVVKERFIDNVRISDFFKKKLTKFFNKVTDTEIKYVNDKIVVNNSHFDYVINCTNNQYRPFDIPFSPFYEHFCSLLYKIEFDDVTAITVMDGEFFSIFPYNLEERVYSVTHVKHGVLSRGNQFSEGGYSDSVINSVRINIEKEVLNIIPDIKNLWTYKGYFISSKTKYDFQEDDRSIRTFEGDKYISFSGGKITGIFKMEPILDALIL